MRSILLPFLPVLCTLPLWVSAGMTSSDLLQQASAQQPAYLDTLESLVSIDSGTGHEAGLNQVAEQLVKRLETLGATVETHSAEPSRGKNIVATLQGKGHTDFLLMIHYDTVFSEGEATRRPFRVDGPRAYGPGVADAKGGVALVLHALELLKQQRFEDYGRITVLFNPDEEIGSAGSKALITELARKHDYVFSYEPPDRDAVTTSTNGINGVVLEVKGRASHAGSAPEEGRNAITELAHHLTRLQDLGDKEKGTTVNWTLIDGGEKRNIIPDHASASADMRYSIASETERVLEDAKRIIQQPHIADTTSTVRIDAGRPPLSPNEGSDRLAKVAQRLYSEIGKTLPAVAMRFGTDAGYAYVPGSDKPAILETLGVVGAGLHSPDEYLELNSIAPRLYLTVALIRELSGNRP